MTAERGRVLLSFGTPFRSGTAEGGTRFGSPPSGSESRESSVVVFSFCFLIAGKNSTSDEVEIPARS